MSLIEIFDGDIFDHLREWESFNFPKHFLIQGTDRILIVPCRYSTAQCQPKESFVRVWRLTKNYLDRSIIANLKSHYAAMTEIGGEPAAERANSLLEYFTDALRITA